LEERTVLYIGRNVRLEGKGDPEPFSLFLPLSRSDVGAIRDKTLVPEVLYLEILFDTHHTYKYPIHLSILNLLPGKTIHITKMPTTNLQDLNAKMQALVEHVSPTTRPHQPTSSIFNPTTP
jgi:hypothetical protein